MMKEMFRIIVLVACLAVFTLQLAGCSSSRGAIKGQSTDVGVKLEQKNYRVIKAAAQGQSSGFRLLGIIPFASPKLANAKRDLYNSVDVPLEGKAIALVNQTEDRSLLYFILFSIPKITLNADIIEYVDE